MVVFGRQTMARNCWRRYGCASGIQGVRFHSSRLLSANTWMLYSRNGSSRVLKNCLVHGRKFSTSSLYSGNDGGVVQAKLADVSVDIRYSRPGDRIQIPYELTVSEGMLDFWQSSFHDQARITTSTPFARKIGLQDRVLPFSLVSFLTCSMTHADTALVQVALDNAIYHWPAFAGDTFTKSFQVKSVRNTSSGDRTVINFACELINQRGRICMTADKQMMFPFTVSGANPNVSFNPNTNLKQHQLLRDHILAQADKVKELGNQSLMLLRPGDSILHGMRRSCSLSQSQQLASLAKLSHERHFDIHKFDPASEILVPGGAVLGLILSASSRDLHEILHEEVNGIKFLHPVHPGDVVGAVTFIHNVDESICTGDLECATLTTVGIKNFDFTPFMDKKSLIDIPLDLFDSNVLRSTKRLEEFCATSAPFLQDKVVALVKRKIIRQAKRKDMFLL